MRMFFAGERGEREPGLGARDDVHTVSQKKVSERPALCGEEPAYW